MYFERIGPQYPVLAPRQAPAAFYGLPPSVPWPPCLGGLLCSPTTLKPTETQVLRVHYWKPGAGPSGSLLGHAGLRGHPSHGGEAPRASGRLPVGEAGLPAISACIASQGAPCQCPLACPGPFQGCWLLERRWPPGPVPHFLWGARGGREAVGTGGRRPGSCRAGRLAGAGGLGV